MQVVQFVPMHMYACLVLYMHIFLLTERKHMDSNVCTFIHAKESDDLGDRKCHKLLKHL